MYSFLLSIRFRIFVFFSLSSVGFTAAVIFSLSQLQEIGTGLDRINECYLPLSKEVAYTQASMRLLEQEHERIRLAQPSAASRAPFYLSRLRENLRDIDLFLQEHRNLDSLQTESSVFERISNTKEQSLNHLLGYQKSLEAWKEDTQKRTINDLSRHKTELSLSVNQLSNLVGERIQDINAQNVRAKEKGYFFGIALTALAVSLSFALVAVALRTVDPLKQLTVDVQRLAQGNYTHRLQSKSAFRSGQEVAVLSHEFNNMAQAVEEREYALSMLFERLQKIIDTIDSAIILTEEGVVSMLNPAAKLQWNLSPKDRLPSSLSVLPVGFHKEQQIENEQYDIRISLMEGFGLLWTIEQVTQRIREQEQLSRTRRLAIVGRMLAQITHEVRNPLNAMSLNTEMLFDEELGGEAQEMLSIISLEIQRLEKITERYLSLSRKRSADLVEASPKVIIKELLQFSASVYENISFTLSGSDETTILDEEAVRSAIRNLIRNAAEAHATTIDINISFGEPIIITIQDDGEGTESIEQIFDPFFTTKAQGTGLGLVISQQELEESGCSLHCTSTVGVGTCFTMTIPHRIEEHISEETHG